MTKTRSIITGSIASETRISAGLANYGTTNKNNSKFMFERLYSDFLNEVITHPALMSNNTKHLERYNSITISLPQNWCKTMDWLEEELNISSAFCLHCKGRYKSFIQYHFFRRYKVCDSCLTKLLVEYKKRKSEINFEQFIENKRVMDVLTLYN